MHLVLVFAIVTLFSSTSTAQPYAHNWTERSAYGDSANYTWPPPDSTFVQNRIVMKFRPYVLNYDSLSYDCDTMGTSGLTSDSAIYFPECKKTLMAQKFTLQIVKDVLIRTELSNHGVTHLMRMTAAHPYLDTLSLTSIGDTIPMRHFDYVVAYLNNDTSVLSLLEGLYYFDSSGLEYAEPVYYGEFARTPADPFFLSQKSFSPSVTGIGMEDAWDYNRGDYAEGIGRIRVAVIDDGIDYFRCDLGSFNFESGLNLKVYGGWDYAFFTDPYDNHYYPASMEGIYFEAGHGTPIAGIIGAFTNDNACDPPGAVASGMAGIAGGWRGGGSWLGPQTLGAKLYGYNISYREPPGVKRKPLSDFAASAILEASSSSLSSKYGYNVDVINCSWFFQPKVPLVVREAISESFHHLVNFAACTGNDETNFSYYPAATENSLLVTGVGATRSDLSRAIYSNWFPPMDVVAPGGDLHPPTNRYPNSEVDQLDFSIMLDETDGHDYASGFRDVLGTFEGTSFATPHVAGAMALLRAFNYDHGLASI